MTKTMVFAVYAASESNRSWRSIFSQKQAQEAKQKSNVLE